MKKTKKDKNKISSSRHKRQKTRKKDIKIRSIDRRISKRKRDKEKIYRRRRLALLTILLILIFFIVRSILGYLNRYNNYSYPTFRDSFLEEITKDILIANTEDRALTSAEKKDDFNKLYELIIRNHVVDKDNEENFKKLNNSYEEFLKKVEVSKTDQEFYDIIDSFLNILDDNKTKILDRKTYDMIFAYYKEENKSPRAKVLGNSQVVNRYKRLLGKKSDLPSMEIKENGKILEIKMPSFNSANLSDDMEKIKYILAKNSNIENIYLDLSDNESLDDKYAFKLLSLLIHDDYQKEKLIFYRGNLLKENLQFLKESKANIGSSFVRNPSSKYPDDLNYLNKNNYMYYDTITIKIEKDREVGNKKLFILTNENTKNSPVSLSYILKSTSDAYIVKNTLESNPTSNDKISYLRSDFFKLDHSGFVISINDSIALDEDDKYLNYDQMINTEDPKPYVFENIK